MNICIFDWIRPFLLKRENQDELLTSPNRYLQETRNKTAKQNVNVQDSGGMPLLLDRDLVIVDIGCRWGFAEKLKQNTNQICIYGFDPDAEECERLSKVYAGQNVTFVPLGLAETPGKRLLYITKEPACSSLYRPDPYLTETYPILACAQEVSTRELETTTLDSWANESRVHSIDYLKIDTQGSELNILKGATSILKTVRALEVEVEFNPIYIDQPLFSDVDAFLRSQGFVLLKLTNQVHYSDQSQNCSIMNHDTVHFDSLSVQYETYGGQLYWADAHYVRKEMLQLNYADCNQLVRDAMLMKVVGFTDIANRLMSVTNIRDTK